MLSRRLIVLLTLAAVAFATMVVAGQGAGSGCASSPETSDDATPAGPGSATSTPTATASPSGTGPVDAGASPGGVSSADALAAVRTLRRFCDLVDARRLRAARRLLAGPWVWPRRELLPVSALRLVSARVKEGRQGGVVVLLARLHARLHGPGPLHDGVNTLFFTLGRDGTTGDWLITAVTSSP